MWSLQRCLLQGNFNIQQVTEITWISNYAEVTCIIGSWMNREDINNVSVSWFNSSLSSIRIHVMNIIVIFWCINLLWNPLLWPITSWPFLIIIYNTQRFKSLAEIHFAETSSTIGWRRNPTLVKTSKANACLAHTRELEVNRIAGPLIMPPQV